MLSLGTIAKEALETLSKTLPTSNLRDDLPPVRVPARTPLAATASTMEYGLGVGITAGTAIRSRRTTEQIQSDVRPPALRLNMLMSRWCRSARLSAAHRLH